MVELIYVLIVTGILGMIFLNMFLNFERDKTYNYYSVRYRKCQEELEATEIIIAKLISDDIEKEKVL